MKVLYLVTSSNQAPWKNIRQRGQAKTWFKDAITQEARYVAVFGNGALGVSSSVRHDFHLATKGQKRVLSIPLPTHIEDHIWIFDSNSGWDSILTSTLGALDFAMKNFDFDFVIRTVASSYWNVKATEDILSRFDSEILYMGNVTNNLETKYVEGDGIILSRNCADLLVKNCHLLQMDVIDDVAIGRAFRDLGVEPVHLGRPWIRNLFDIRSPSLVPLNQIHTFRCKYEISRFGLKLRRDANLMRNLHRILR
jgi:hypothetical protein